MYWLYLLAALACLFGAYQASGWVVVPLLLVALLGFLAWVLGWAAAQAARGGGAAARILSPEDLRRLREQSEARKAADAGPPPAR
jgi:hypothetical protein